ncbi:hypothetical protein CH275_18435 [Rhodococcus sp. 06-235-1A]|uniref:hypothetical protein n=1 Tax=Rhodococcus sp. 06-235-1A TaxID=2022508 RepID=UPI000B9C414A|nr:hypothetical protein [Rhodococcus sp. 06-235-1A]OZD01781.1 hypothetical protein CH275_18435 [Rhodococcus sp. 06-235-1A]
MTDLDIECRSAGIDYERALMRSPLAAQLRVVQYRIRVKMTEQGAVYPRDLVASALPSSRHATLNSA